MTNGRTVFLCALPLLTACHHDPNPPAQIAASSPLTVSPVKRGPSQEELTTGMVEAVTVGKSSVPVGLKFDLPTLPIVGRPVEIILAILPQIDADPAILQVQGSEGLTLVSDAVPLEMPQVAPGQVYRHNVTINPTAEGVQLLAVTLLLKHDDVTESRVFSVPLIVAAGPDLTAVTKR